MDDLGLDLGGSADAGECTLDADEFRGIDHDVRHVSDHAVLPTCPRQVAEVWKEVCAPMKVSRDLDAAHDRERHCETEGVRAFMGTDAYFVILHRPN